MKSGRRRIRLMMEQHQIQMVEGTEAGDSAVKTHSSWFISVVLDHPLNCDFVSLQAVEGDSEDLRPNPTHSRADQGSDRS